MYRRRFLAALGATAIAGCTAQTTSTDDGSTTTRPTSTPTRTPTPTSTPARTTTERPTTETEAANAWGRELVDRGRVHVEAAIAAFVEEAEGPDPTIVDVTAATTDFSRYDVNEAYTEAKEDLNVALEHTEGGLADEAEDLLRVAELVQALGLVQIHLVNAYGGVSAAVRSLYTENYGKLADDVDDVDQQRTLAADHATALRGSFDASIFTHVGGLTGDHFEAKVAQVDRELATFERLAASLDGMDAALESFERDVGRYTAMNYEGVSFTASAFEDAAGDLTGIEPAGSLESIVEELACDFDALAAGANVMQKAVLARRNDDRDMAREYESEAEAEFRSCDTLVAEVAPVADLVDSI